MARVKTGPHRRRHHKKVLKMTKGQFGSRHQLFRIANEAMLKSLWYS
jgi:large subunit ribosomal protein L20